MDDDLTFRPYECRIPFRDIVPGGIQLRSRYDGDRVTVYLSIRSRRPAKYSRRLENHLTIGREAIWDRHATEADFMGPDISEAAAGPIQALVDDRLIVNVSTNLQINL